MFFISFIVIPLVFAIIVSFDSAKLHKKDPSVNPYLAPFLVLLSSYIIFFLVGNKIGGPSGSEFAGNNNVLDYLGLLWGWIGIYLLPLLMYIIWSYLKHRKLKLHPVIVTDQTVQASKKSNLIWLIILLIVVLLPFIWILLIFMSFK